MPSRKKTTTNITSKKNSTPISKTPAKKSVPAEKIPPVLKKMDSLLPNKAPKDSPITSKKSTGNSLPGLSSKSIESKTKPSVSVTPRAAEIQSVKSTDPERKKTIAPSEEIKKLQDALNASDKKYQTSSQAKTAAEDIIKPVVSAQPKTKKDAVKPEVPRIDSISAEKNMEKESPIKGTEAASAPKLKKAAAKPVKPRVTRKVSKKAESLASKSTVSSEAILPSVPVSHLAGRGTYSDVTSVQSTKFEIEPRQVYIEPQYPPEETLTLPQVYGETRIVALCRDPQWGYVYWEISEKTRTELSIPRGRHTRQMALRTYDITGIKFNGHNAHGYFDIPVNDLAVNWYLQIPDSGRIYCVDIGVFDEFGKFIMIARSNVFSVPRDTISSDLSEDWLEVQEKYFSELFRMSGGLSTRGSSASASLLQKVHEEMLEKHKKAVSSGAFSSAIVPHKVQPRESDFWFQVGTELIVFGATEPSASVYLQGDRITLQADGTFNFRFALPDGKQVIPIVAIKSDKSQTREVTITVEKKTA